MEFSLDSRLQNDSIILGDFTLSRLLLMNDKQFPWFTLVPRRENKQEVYQLNESDQSQLWLESRVLSIALMDIYHGDKLNLAAIGNIVSQLHLHHVVRFKDDICWPKPIWGQVPMKNYSTDEIETVAKTINDKIGCFGFKPIIHIAKT